MKDKIIFWLDADITHFGIAKFLQDKYDCDLYAIIDITDKPKKFFQEQQLVHFKKVWFYHDFITKTKEKPDLKYLADFEEKYKINLWLIAYNERLFYLYNEYYKFSTDEVLKILEQECRLFENILDEIKPDFLIMRATDLHQNHLFYQTCKVKNIKILLLGQSRFAYRPIISSLWHKIDTKYDPNIIGPNRTIEELQNYLKDADTFKQTTDYTSKFQRSKIDRFQAVYKFLTSNNNNEKTHYTYYGRTKLKVLIRSIRFLLRKKYREIYLNHSLLREIDEKDKFIYFPMHLDQESTLLIGAPFYTNQIEIITHIVKSLPVGFKLYVKEHPAQSLRAWRKTAFYKQIKNLPNVKLIHPSIKPENILKKCSLVISITSTASLEAAFYKKPSIILADAPYDILPSVYRLRSIEDLPQAIRTSLKIEVNPSDLNKYVNYVNENSFQIDVFGIELGYAKHFYHDGNLVDVNITTSQMESYLEKFNREFEQLSVEHIKKIKQHKESESIK